MGAQGQAHAPGTESKDTLDNRVVPIVFIPGVMGSRLDISGAASDWDPDDTAEMAGWLTASLRQNVRDIDFRTPATVMTGLSGFDSGNDPGNEIADRQQLRRIAVSQLNPRPPSRGERSAVIQFWERRGWGELVWSFYKDILIDLEEQLNPDGGELRPVYAVGYDWRGGNRDSARRLIRRVGEFLGRHPLAKQVVIVSHSMGGLVTRSALAQGLEARVAGVVHTVMPADGAAVAYRRFLTGARDEYQDGERPFRVILGNSRLNYSLMQSVLRGPTELLPSNSYPDPFVRLPGDIHNKFFQDVYAEYERNTPPGILFRQGESLGFFDKITPTDVTNLRDRIREARTFTASVAGRVHPRTFLLIGQGLVNDVEFDFTKGTPTADGAKMQTMVIRRPDGDGTVPLASARFSAATSALGRRSFPVEHAACFANADFRKAVLANVRQLLKP